MMDRQDKLKKADGGGSENGSENGSNEDSDNEEKVSWGLLGCAASFFSLGAGDDDEDSDWFLWWF